jgi:hypothetical protein
VAISLKPGTALDEFTAAQPVHAGMDYDADGDRFLFCLGGERGKVYVITPNATNEWDLSVLAAAQFGSNSARQTAYGAEVGYLLRQNLWLSAGFNASGFAGDADLVGYEYTRRGAYVRLRFKFDENLFKGRDPEVNRSLDR